MIRKKRKRIIRTQGGTIGRHVFRPQFRTFGRWGKRERWRAISKTCNNTRPIGKRFRVSIDFGSSVKLLKSPTACLRRSCNEQRIRHQCQPTCTVLTPSVCNPQRPIPLADPLPKYQSEHLGVLRKKAEHGPDHDQRHGMMPLHEIYQLDVATAPVHNKRISNHRARTFKLKQNNLRIFIFDGKHGIVKIRNISVAQRLIRAKTTRQDAMPINGHDRINQGFGLKIAKIFTQYPS